MAVASPLRHGTCKSASSEWSYGYPRQVVSVRADSTPFADVSNCRFQADARYNISYVLDFHSLPMQPGLFSRDVQENLSIKE